jgi:uncharacterized membrane protein YdbT with pleckstrin-like domain
MSYIKSQLLPGEEIKYRGHLHRIIFAPAWFFILLALPALVIASSSGDWPVFYALAIPALIAYTWAKVIYTTSEFAITNKRVVIKVGWLRRRTVETMLGKVEGINVDQSVIGRLLGYGSIVITGTGGTAEPFRNIGAPFEFRRQVQAQVSAAEDQKGPIRSLEGAPAPMREERDCPYCAERVLARARVCKHCGREIEPILKA